ncbi:uncharacterized protein LOC115998751 [Ipomoea triloba]|uniref:uncharacterized protein LOC115998751 n=1 Tax=Ipomoea triloba TaxID=35885 RepID=UPI00125D0C7C|nr:uncharacterized protein LOC115998751 [Ipomoea triloba]
MEGLIPLVFRTIKRTRTRRQYQCLSSGGAADGGAFNIQDFYPNGYYGGGGNMISQNDYGYNGDRRKGGENVGADGRRHRRHMSLQVEYSGGFSPERGAAAASKSSKQLVRFKSHRMFSCVTGA